MKPGDARPSSDFPEGTRITMLDAWMQNPVEGKVVMLPNADHVVMEDSRGIRYFGHTSRIVASESTPAQTSAYIELLVELSCQSDEFADLLG